MATKFYNNQARFFNQLLNGADFETIFKNEVQKIDETQYSCSEAQANAYREADKNGLLEVKKFFDKIKFFDKPEHYAVNGWGYGQTNYENFKVLGQAGGSMVCVLNSNYSDVYTISKAKYTNKDTYTYLDSNKVRSTSWGEVFTDDEIHENSMYNAYNGH